MLDFQLFSKKKYEDDKKMKRKLKKIRSYLLILQSFTRLPYLCQINKIKNRLHIQIYESKPIIKRDRDKVQRISLSLTKRQFINDDILLFHKDFYSFKLSFFINRI